MLKIERALQKLMTLLRSMKPKFVLPVGLEKFLQTHMDEYAPKPNEVLLAQGKTPQYAYYIIRGYIYVTYLDEKGGPNIKRFYKENEIVAFMSFLERTASPFTIRAGRDTLLSRISWDATQKVFLTWPEMRLFADVVVMGYDELHDKIRSGLLDMTAKERVAEFYQVLYPCLLPANKVRLNALISKYLKVSIRRLLELRTELGIR